MTVREPFAGIRAPFTGMRDPLLAYEVALLKGPLELMPMGPPAGMWARSSRLSVAHPDSNGALCCYDGPLFI